MMSNTELSKLLLEAADLLSTDDNDALNEGIGGLIAPFVPLAIYLGSIIGLSVLYNRAYYKDIAKNKAKAVTREEIADGVKFLNSLDNRIELIFKQSKYKDFVNENVISLRKEFIDISKSKDIKHIPFSVYYNLFSINMIKLSQLEDEYDKAVVTQDRLSDYLKKETEAIAKVCDKVRDLVKTNSFFKEHFDVVLCFNENKSVAYCDLVLKHPLVLNTSKYLK